MKSDKNMQKIILAVDIGGTKIAVAGITIEGQILSRMTVPTLQEGPEKGIAQIISLLESLIQEARIDIAQVIGIGVGIPAVLEPETDFIIWGPNLVGWRNIDLRGSLERHFFLPACIEYDGHTAALGEWWQGAAVGYQSAVSIVIGTGVGGGFVLDGKLIRGINRLAGAVGWFVLDPHNESASVKARALGSWESRIAGPGIAQHTRQLLEMNPEIGSSLQAKKMVISAEAVFDAAKQNDPMALRVTDEIAELIGRGIANIVSILNPEIIVLGGSIGSNSAFILPKIKATVDRFAQPISSQSVKLASSQLGADAGLFGAAYGMMLRLNLHR